MLEEDEPDQLSTNAPVTRCCAPWRLPCWPLHTLTRTLEEVHSFSGNLVW